MVMEQLTEHLEKLLTETIAEHRRRKDTLRRASWALHIGVLLAGTCVTVLLGIKSGNESYMVWSRNAALILGGLGTLLTALLSFWNLDAYWLQRKVILNQLISLHRQFQYLRAAQNSIGEVQLRAVFDEFERITGRHAEYWEAVLSQIQGDPTITSVLPRSEA
ncbi:SLATT domain-containing protein [Streptomyces sp. NPDC058256]|uniref:SLATT domain-containing protein n=1 Tax=Streptomyces sp. NPDC058256 TaxID=3346408 RepID=UPI0036E6D643